MDNSANALIFWSTLIIGLVFVIWKLFFKTSRFNKLVAKIPGPPEFLCFGNLRELSKHHAEILPTFTKWYKEYGKHKVFKFSTVRWIYVIPCCASSVEVILNNSHHIQKSFDYALMEPWLGNGLLISKGEKWKTRRKLLTPAFHFRILEDFIAVFNEHSNIMVKQLSLKAGKGVFDIFSYITLCTLDIICETAMGCHLNAQIDTNSDYVDALYKVSEIIFNRILSPWLQIKWIFKLLPMSREHDRCLKILHSFTKNVIEERKQERKQFKPKLVENQDDAQFGNRKRMAFLDLLLETSQEGKVLSDMDIQEEVDTFMFEGHDTTAAAIASTLYLLGRNQEHQLKVQQELDDVLGTNDDVFITSKDLTNLKYLELVIKESLRLLPPVPLFGRKLTSDVCIENCVIPAGAVFQITPYLLHRDPEVFPDPEKFDPDRFLINNAMNRNPYAYVPFSAGPRNCIGQKFAMMEVKILLAHVLRRYVVKSTQSMEELKLVPDLILRPMNGFRVTLTSRK